MSSSSGELPITSVFSCGARSLTACASFKFAGCWWRRSLAVAGGSGTRPGCAGTFPAAGRTWQGMACVRSGHHTAAAPGDGRSARQDGPGPGHRGARLWDAGPDSAGQALDRNPRRWPSGKQPRRKDGPPLGPRPGWRHDGRAGMPGFEPAAPLGAVLKDVTARQRPGGTRCAGPGHWLVLVIAWPASASGSWWPAVGGVAGEHVPALLTAGQAPPVAGPTPANR